MKTIEKEELYKVLRVGNHNGAMMQMVTEMGAMDSSVEQRRLLVRNGGANKF